jgi:hypothetical protein
VRRCGNRAAQNARTAEWGAESEEPLGRLTFLDIRWDTSIVGEVPSDPHLATLPGTIFSDRDPDAISADQ